MYGKLFSSMYEGTLYGQWEALVTFQQMIVLADADGIVDITTIALSARTGIPMEIIEKGIEVLEAIDPYSRTEDEEGRRISRIDDHRPWGWRIVNHAKYKNLQDSDTVREQTRERVRRFREKKQKETASNEPQQPVTDGNGQKRHTDTDTDTRKSTSAKANGCPYQSITDLYHEILPHAPRIKKMTPSRQAAIRTRWHQDLSTLEAWREFFRQVKSSDFLCGRSASNGREPFVANLEWLTKTGNFTKVIEGNYQNRSNGNGATDFGVID